MGEDGGQGAVKDRPLIGAVGEQFPEKGAQRRELVAEHGAAPFRHVSGGSQYGLPQPGGILILLDSDWLLT